MNNISIQTGSVKKTLLIILLGVTLFVLLVTKCNWSAQQGVVLDEATGEPLAEAFVTARYSGNIPTIGDFQTVCYHAAGTKTDTQGRYQLPAKFVFGGILIDKRLDMSFFKPGYRQVFYDDFHGIAKLRKDGSNREERFDELKRVTRVSDCRDAGESERSLYPLYEAVFYEAKNLAFTKENVKDLGWIRSISGIIATASDKARIQTEADLEEEQFLKDHLR